MRVLDKQATLTYNGDSNRTYLQQAQSLIQDARKELVSMGRRRGLLGRIRGWQGGGRVPEAGSQRLEGSGVGGFGSAAGGGLISLGLLNKGERGIVEGLQAGHTLVSRLSVLGFTPGAEVEMVQNFGYGPVIVSVRDTRIALGRGEVAKILVRRSVSR